MPFVFVFAFNRQQAHNPIIDGVVRDNTLIYWQYLTSLSDAC